MVQKRADATLPSLAEIVLPECQRGYGERPSVQAQIDALPSMMKSAPLGLKCPQAVNGWNSKAFKQTAQKCKRNKEGINTTEIESDVGAIRSAIGKLDYAVLRINGEGAWITASQLMQCQEHDLDRDRDDPALIWFGEGVDIQQIFVQESSNRMYLANLTVFEESTGAWTVLYKEQHDDKTFGTWSCKRETQVVDLHTLQVLTHNKRGVKEHAGAVGENDQSMWGIIDREYDSGTWIEVQEDKQWRRAKMYRHQERNQVVLWQPGTRAIESTVEGFDPAYTLVESFLFDSEGERMQYRPVGKRTRQDSDDSEGSGTGDSDSSDPDDSKKDTFHKFWVSREHFGMDFIQRKLKISSVGGDPINIDEARR